MDERSAVLCGASRLDIELAGLIKAIMPVDGAEILKRDKVFGPDRPLGTFSSRTRTAYRLGLIDKPLYDAINVIRNIRNEFAHSISPIVLSEGPNADRIETLNGIMSQYPFYGRILKTNQSAKNKLVGSIMALLVFIKISAKHAKPLGTFDSTLHGS